MRISRRLIFALSLCLLSAWLTGYAQRPADSSVRSRLLGTWSLAKYDSKAADAMAARGPKPIGVLYYDSTGHMAVQIAPDRTRRRFTGPESGLFSGPRPTLEEALDAVSGYAAYFGTYSVDERARTVTHKRVANINPTGLGDFVRRFEFVTADRLVLTPLELTDSRAVTLTWERLK